MLLDWDLILPSFSISCWSFICPQTVFLQQTCFYDITLVTVQLIKAQQYKADRKQDYAKLEHLFSKLLYIIN